MTPPVAEAIGTSGPSEAFRSPDVVAGVARTRPSDAPPAGPSRLALADPRRGPAVVRHHPHRAAARRLARARSPAALRPHAARSDRLAGRRARRPRAPEPSRDGPG